jgi:hypothetical protein
MNTLKIIFLAVLLAFILIPFAGAGENCAQLSGTCREACGQNEEKEAGAFEDCGEKQECCIASSSGPIQCCVISFEQKDFGPKNCSVPVNGICGAGTESPAPCAKLGFCK